MEGAFMNSGLALLLVFGIGVPALRILMESPRDTPVSSANRTLLSCA
jgi:hypothetical protein